MEERARRDASAASIAATVARRSSANVGERPASAAAVFVDVELSRRYCSSSSRPSFHLDIQHLGRRGGHADHCFARAEKLEFLSDEKSKVETSEEIICNHDRRSEAQYGGVDVF